MARTILVIEDNQQNMYMIGFLLRTSGYTVLEAYDGFKGLQMSQSTQPDAILLDIQLPRMDGYEVCRRLKEDPVTSSIPVIAVTSYAMVGDRERILAQGADGYIEKPIDPDTFIREMERFLSDKGETY